jgi:hypothetical protein
MTRLGYTEHYTTLAHAKTQRREEKQMYKEIE